MQNKKLPWNEVANIVVEETLPFFFKPPYHEVGQSGTLHAWRCVSSPLLRLCMS